MRHFTRFLFSYSLVLVCLAASAEPEIRDEAKLNFVESPLAFGLDIQYSAVRYHSYKFTPDHTNDRYGHGVRVALEWLPIERYGKWGIGLGATGVFGLNNLDVGGGNIASLGVLPLDAFVSLRLEFQRRQLFVPYVRAGASVILARQTSSTGAEISGTRTYVGRDLTAGIEICLSRIDPSASRELDRVAGVNSTYLSLEVTDSATLSGASGPDLSHQAYRAGLRFEL